MPKLRWVSFKNEEEPLLSLQDLIEQGWGFSSTVAFPWATNRNNRNFCWCYINFRSLICISNNIVNSITVFEGFGRFFNL